MSKEAEIIAKGIVRDTTFEVSDTGEQLALSRAAQSADDGRWRIAAGAP